MKSFLGFVPCLRPPLPTTPPRSDEARSFTSGQPRSLNGSNSVSSSLSSSSSSSSSSTAQWQPSLCSISEDDVVSVVVEKAEETARSSKKVARKTASRAKIRVRTTYSDGFGRASVPLAIPAFSATGFLF